MTVPKVLKEKCPRAGCKGNLARTGEVYKRKGRVFAEYKCLLCTRTTERESTLDRNDFRSYS